VLRIGAGISRALVYAPRDPQAALYSSWKQAFVGGSYDFLRDGACSWAGGERSARTEDQDGEPGRAVGSMRCRRMSRMTAMMTSARMNRKAPA
jgi:hypothetical protein